MMNSVFNLFETCRGLIPWKKLRRKSASCWFCNKQGDLSYIRVNLTSTHLSFKKKDIWNTVAKFPLEKSSLSH